MKTLAAGIPPDAATGLGTILDFGPADLRANRQGRLSRLQAARLRRRLILGFIGGSAFFAVMGWLSRAAPVVAGVCFLLIVILAWGFPRSIRALRTLAVTQLEGAITPKQIGGLRPRFYFVMGEQSFSVPHRAIELLEIHRPYRVYVTARYQPLLSLERVDELQGSASDEH